MCFIVLEYNESSVKPSSNLGASSRNNYDVINRKLIFLLIGLIIRKQAKRMPDIIVETT